MKPTATTRVLITQPLDFTEANPESLLHRANLLGELFGEPDLVTEKWRPFLGIRLRRLKLAGPPAGQMPWSQLRRRLEPVLRDLGERQGPAARFPWLC